MVSVTRPAPVMVRVRVTGEEFADFVSSGPTDHMRVFFPDPAGGQYHAPTPAGPGQDGIVRPDGETYPRDFTPLRVLRTAGEVAVDIDFYVHASPGPASMWAQRAAPGDELVVVGPRGSRNAPQDADRLLLIVDETALPAAARFAREVPATTAVDLVAVTADDGAWVAGYFSDASDRTDISVRVVAAPAQPETLVAAVETVGAVGTGTFVFAAGEASALLPLRRYLRRDLRLPREQVAISGYWRRGVTAFDHHTPVDPDDPD